MKTLIIAEKPSVATDLARVLGVKKQGDFYENEDYVISSAVGHLVELFMPEDIDKKLKRWSLQTLPILPEKFELKPIEKTQKKFQELKKLLRRKDVDAVVNACDAGREGELIFTYIYELAGAKLPVKRLWMTSMTADAIRDAFKNLRSQESMLPLQEAARCRSESDWLVGINGTRAITSRMYGHRGGSVATVGRVQTPTLTLVVDREIEIRNFKSRTYWRLVGRFEIKEGDYEGVYQKPDFKKGPDEHDRIDRIWDKAQADALLAALRESKVAAISEDKKRTTQAAPRLYDLTSLQREANNRFSLPAGRTLSIAQSLYEKHKMITYPRTDSRALPEDYGSSCADTMRAVGGDCARHAAKVIENNWINPKNRRIFNNKQISDHFAIIPTPVTDKKLTDDEAKVYDMILRRFIAVFYPSAEFDVTTRTTSIGEHGFKTEGKILAVPGWMAVYGKSATDEATLPAVTDGDGQPPQATILDVSAPEDATRPPPRFTEATLLAAMEGAGKLVEDDDLADAMKEKGLGTPATRAQTIEHLINLKYIERQQRELVPLAKAESLIEFLKAVQVEVLTSPALTGEWEYRLRQMEEGRLTREEFMKGIRSMTEGMISRTRDFDEEKATARETSILSPTDGKPLLETFRAYRSQDGALAVYKTIGNRKLEPNELEVLIRDRQIGPLDGFRSKAGRPYSAVLRLDEENKVKFVFDNNGNGGGEGDEGSVDLSTFPEVGTCPKADRGLCSCKDALIRETPNAYTCERNGQEGCKFRVSRTLLNHTISPDEFRLLITTGKTGVIEDFVSKRTRRRFSAHLVLNEKGDVGFEFPPRPAGGARKKPAAKPKPKS